MTWPEAVTTMVTVAMICTTLVIGLRIWTGYAKSTYEEDEDDE